MSTDKELFHAADDIADNLYDPTQYKSESITEKGLAVTHEQVSDTYMEGTNDGRIDAYEGNPERGIPETGYDNMFQD